MRHKPIYKIMIVNTSQPYTKEQTIYEVYTKRTRPTTSVVIAKVVGYGIVVYALSTCTNIYVTIEIIHDYIGGKENE